MEKEERMSIKLVIFDMAGTTVFDGDAVHTALCEAMTASGYPATRDEANEVMGMPKPTALRILLERKVTDPADITPEFVDHVHNDFLERMLNYYRTNPAVREIPGAAKVFAALHSRGVKVALDTGFSRPIADAILERLGWQTLLDTTVTSDEVKRGRPYPDMTLEAMRRLGIEDVKETAKVGDTPSDLQEGDSAGCALVIGVTEGSHTEAQLKPYPHTHLLPNITHLPALLDTLYPVGVNR